MYILSVKGLHHFEEGVYKQVYASEDLSSIKEELKKRVLDGVPLKDLMVTKTVDFDFKCAIQFNEGKETEKKPLPRFYAEDNE